MWNLTKKTTPVAPVVANEVAAVAVAAVAVATATAVIEVPVAVKVGFGDDSDIMSEWISVGKELGITAGKVPEMELKAFLMEEGIHVYKTQDVFDYLTAKATESGSVWKHYGLRQVDHDRYATNSFWADVSAWPRGHGYLDTQRKQYRSSIPLPVLLTAKRISDHFGAENVSFYVAGVDNDPFLGVCLQGSNLVYVERWDEPGFRER